MESETFRSRVLKLLQKSRKASRLYGGVSRQQVGENAEFSELQLSEWGEINSGLVRHLKAFADAPNGRESLRRAYLLRDHYYSQWRENEAESRNIQGLLIEAAKREDYIQCAGLSRKLIVLRARYQACQAVHNELQALLSRSSDPGQINHHTVESDSVFSPLADTVQEGDQLEELDQHQAKVLPFNPRR